MNVWLDSIRVTSTCPTCNDLRDQGGFGSRALIRFLIDDHPIPAWCVVCGGRWEISEIERAELAKRVKNNHLTR